MPSIDGVICVGASGHAKVVADILRVSGETIAGFLDDDEARAGTEFFGARILGTVARLRELRDSGFRRAIVAVGANGARERLAASVRERGFDLVTAVHPRATVASGVEIGEGTVVMAGATINPGARIGACVIVNTNASIDHDCDLGDSAHVSPGASLAGGVVVGARAHIGIGASVIQGVRIGEDAIVGAGAAVIRDVPAAATVAGVPARALGSRTTR